MKKILKLLLVDTCTFGKNGNIFLPNQDLEPLRSDKSSTRNQNEHETLLNSWKESEDYADHIQKDIAVSSGPSKIFNPNNNVTNSSFIGKLETSILDDRIIDFRENYNLKSDAIITIQPMSNDDNSFKTQDQEFSLEGLEPISIFTNDATYTFNDVEKEIPTVNVYSRNDEEEFLLVTKSKEGPIKRISTTNKKNGRNTEIAPILPGIYAMIKEEDIDYEELNRKFKYSEKTIHNGTSMAHNFFSRFESYFRPNGRKLTEQTNECQEYYVVELAVAYESSFCAKVGGTEEAAVDEVVSLVAAVNHKFEQPGVCIKIVLSHLEGYCDSKVDPYTSIVNLRISGCDECEEGAIHRVRDYWIEHRQPIKRDSMALFSGTDFQGGEVGCSWKQAVCQSYMYGVNHVTFTGSANVRAVLIAHELGHNIGASHSSEGYIMHEIIDSAENGFAVGSKDAMLDILSSRRCSDVCASHLCCVDNSECDNGLFCDGIESCDGYGCVPSTVSPCDDGDICTEDICHEGDQTCTHIPIPGCCETNSDCDNGLFCDGEEICSNHVCMKASEGPCEDDDVCTLDSCNEEQDICVYEEAPECASPSLEPSQADFPSSQPSHAPSMVDSGEPTMSPSLSPTTFDSEEPSSLPTMISSTSPTDYPSTLPSTACVEDSDCDNGRFCDGVETCVEGTCHYSPTLLCDDGDDCTYDVCQAFFERCVYYVVPNCYPTSSPTEFPSVEPSVVPSSLPTEASSLFPTLSSLPTIAPSGVASSAPSVPPTDVSSAVPSSDPTAMSSSIPSNIPTSRPTYSPSVTGSLSPSLLPSLSPSLSPSSHPSLLPSSSLSTIPTIFSSSRPSSYPSAVPTLSSSILPTSLPLLIPSRMPSSSPHQ